MSLGSSSKDLGGQLGEWGKLAQGTWRSGNKTMKLSSFLILIISLSSIIGFAQERPRAHSSGARRMPKVVKIKVTLLNSPGVNDAGSRWETAYELRIANERTFYEANRQGKFKAGSQERVGELIAKGSFTRKSLRQLKNRNIVLQVPLAKKLQERLEDQPKDRVNLTAATATAENIKLSREQETKAQVIFFYSTVHVYDAKLKKNVVVPIDRIWLFQRHPDADFKIELEVTENGYKVDSR
jgi:hypothetical protein